MAEERRKISELPSNDSPSTSTTLVGVVNGETVQIPITEFVAQDEDGSVYVNGSLRVSDGATIDGAVDIRYGEYLRLLNEDNTHGVTLFSSADGTKLEINDDIVATETYVDTKFESLQSSNSIPYTSFQCFSTSYTIADLMSQLQDEGVVNINGQPIIVSFTGMLSGTFLCRLNNYYGIYYGCEFTDLKALKTYYFEGQSPSLSLYENLSSGGTSPGDGSSGDSSIIDLGEEDSHKMAQSDMVHHLEETDAAYGCYLFKYFCPCSTTACLAIVVKYESNTYAINGTVYNDYHQYRSFCYTPEDGFFEDGCWLNIASFDETFEGLPTEDKSVLGAISELHSKIGSGSSTFIDAIESLPSNPSTSSIYRKWDVTRADWMLFGQVVTDGGMVCEVVDTLPDVGNVCYTGTSMYSYFQRSDYEVYGYVDSNLSAMMSVPVGWYRANQLFNALGYSYDGIITDISKASQSSYNLLITFEPSFYIYSELDGKMNKTKLVPEDEVTAIKTRLDALEARIASLEGN